MILDALKAFTQMKMPESLDRKRVVSKIFRIMFEMKPEVYSNFLH